MKIAVKIYVFLSCGSGLYVYASREVESIEECEDGKRENGILYVLSTLVYWCELEIFCPVV